MSTPSQIQGRGASSASRIPRRPLTRTFTGEGPGLQPPRQSLRRVQSSKDLNTSIRDSDDHLPEPTGSLARPLPASSPAPANRNHGHHRDASLPLLGTAGATESAPWRYNRECSCADCAEERHSLDILELTRPWLLPPEERALRATPSYLDDGPKAFASVIAKPKCPHWDDHRKVAILNSAFATLDPSISWYGRWYAGLGLQWEMARRGREDGDDRRS